MILALDGGSTKTIAVVYYDENKKIMSVGLSGSSNYTTNDPTKATSSVKMAIENYLDSGGINLDSIERIIISIVGIGDSKEATGMGKNFLQIS